jgi:hypothetical protein
MRAVCTLRPHPHVSATRAARAAPTARRAPSTITIPPTSATAISKGDSDPATPANPRRSPSLRSGDPSATGPNTPTARASSPVSAVGATPRTAQSPASSTSPACIVGAASRAFAAAGAGSATRPVARILRSRFMANQGGNGEEGSTVPNRTVRGPDQMTT